MGDNQSHNLPLIIITGPTAAGKTQLAMGLYDALPCRLISVDSAQVYRGMDIGTAKPDAAMLVRYPHDLIDLIEPSETYSVASFIRDAGDSITAARRNHQLPVLVGGTTMYIQAILQGLDQLPPADRQLRDELNAEAAEYGWPALYERLMAIDAEAAAAINPNDAQRIQRALEIALSKGDTTVAGPPQGTTGYQNTLVVVVTPGCRNILHKRIEERAETMLEQGLVNEVEILLQQHDLSAEHASIRSVGYRQVVAMLNGDLSGTALQPAIVQATRQLAKRQLTWCRQQSGLIWLDAGWQAKSAFLLKRIAFFVSNNRYNRV